MLLLWQHTLCTCSNKFFILIFFSFIFFFLISLTLRYFCCCSCCCCYCCFFVVISRWLFGLFSCLFLQFCLSSQTATILFVLCAKTFPFDNCTRNTAAMFPTSAHSPLPSLIPFSSWVLVTTLSASWAIKVDPRVVCVPFFGAFHLLILLSEFTCSSSPALKCFLHGDKAFLRAQLARKWQGGDGGINTTES